MIRQKRGWRSFVMMFFEVFILLLVEDELCLFREYEFIRG
jgi:predicted nucleic acid-binding Zn ribbon protein